MQIGMIGLGRMGNYMVQRLMRGGHECVVYDARPESVAELAGLGATGSASLEEFVSKLASARHLADAAGGDHRQGHRLARAAAAMTAISSSTAAIPIITTISAAARS